MKKAIMLIAVFAATIFIMFTFTAQATPNVTVNTEITDDEYVQVDFNNLPTETQDMLLNEFKGYTITAIFIKIENKLLKVNAVKEGEEGERIFIQDEEGKFIEQ